MNIQSAFSGFSVKDLAEAEKFFSEVIGVETEVTKMGLQLKLPGAKDVFVYEKEDHVPATFTILNFVVANIDESIDELKSRGVVFEIYDNLPAEQDDKGVLRGLAANMGPDIAWFKDPSGNILSLLQES